MDNPIRIAPVITISMLGCIRFSRVCLSFAVVSVEGSSDGFFSCRNLGTAIKAPIVKITAPSKNRRSLRIAAPDLPKKVLMFALRYGAPKTATKASKIKRERTIKRTFLAALGSSKRLAFFLFFFKSLSF